MDRFENRLKKAFPEKKVCIDIWLLSEKWTKRPKVYKPFEDRYITFVAVVTRNKEEKK
jgi:hypothetical protein